MEIIKTPLILKSLEQRVGCKIILEPKFKQAGSIEFENGRKFYFKNTSIDINNFGSAEVSRDKGYTRYFMNILGYPIPKGEIFFSDHWCTVNKSNNNIFAAVTYAQQLGFPLIVKPNNKSQGEDVYKVYDARQLFNVLKRLFKKHNIILLEEFIQGNDYRLVVLDNELVMAYQRLPIRLEGNGTNTIEELLSLRLEELRANGRHVSLLINDERIKERLKYFYKVTNDYVPKQYEEITLLDNANLSTGGTAVDVTSAINSGYVSTVIKLIKELGLRFAGVDLITDGNIKEPPLNLKFIEVNSSPGLSHYASLGKKYHRNVENLYIKIVTSLKNMV
ncbi:MAG: cyanophycin synthetase [Candidatus Vogelbacteria bacterium]|nr:cyanophycin synthetase [Candidatus Vogelbacteria bacterium]